MFSLPRYALGGACITSDRRRRLRRPRLPPIQQEQERGTATTTCRYPSRYSPRKIQHRRKPSRQSNNKGLGTGTSSSSSPADRGNQQHNSRNRNNKMWPKIAASLQRPMKPEVVDLDHEQQAQPYDSPTSSWDNESQMPLSLHSSISSSPTSRHPLRGHKKERECSCRGYGHMGKIMLSFAAGAWFALAVLSEYLDSATSTFQLILSGGFFDAPMSAIQKAEPKHHMDRVILINKALSATRRPFGYKHKRQVELYPADYSDATQTYPVTDSNDVDSQDDYQMEMRLFPQHESDPDCVPMSDWQTTYHPTCSTLHEADFSAAIESSEMSLLSSKGNWRDAWELWDRPQSGWSKIVGGHEETVVLKTFKYEHNMEDAFFEFNRVDAISMERLTSSPYVMDIYGFCGMSVVTAYAGETVTDIVDSINPLGKLFMARLIAKGLSDIHGIDGGGKNVSLIHNDINYANIMVGGSRRLPKFNDFNIAVLQMRNKKTGKSCPFTHHFPNPQWRSYEEQVGPTGVTDELSEKIDVYALGNIFYRFVVGKSPWKNAPWRTQYERNSAGQLDPLKITTNDKLRIARLKREEGAMPPIPDDIMKKINEEPALYALYKAMKKCYKFDQAERPSAKDLVDYIDLQLDKLDPEKKGRRNF